MATERSPGRRTRRSGVAGRWRIRHKLMLGLGLVVGILALLLAGTLKGLASYRATTSSWDSKLNELHGAQDLKVAITSLVESPDNVTREDLLARLAAARVKLVEYNERLRFTLDHHRDPDKGFQETGLVKDLEDRF